MINVDEVELKHHLSGIVWESVEETLNAMLDAEADALCQARRYERSSDRLDTRTGHYKRGLLTTAGPVTLKMPKLRNLTFETSIIERYRRKDSSVEKALVGMYIRRLGASCKHTCPNSSYSQETDKMMDFLDVIICYYRKFD